MDEQTKQCLLDISKALKKIANEMYWSGNQNSSRELKGLIDILDEHINAPKPVCEECGGELPHEHNLIKGLADKARAESRDLVEKGMDKAWDEWKRKLTNAFPPNTK